jgi:hypothetical protein
MYRVQWTSSGWDIARVIPQAAQSRSALQTG